MMQISDTIRILAVCSCMTSAAATLLVDIVYDVSQHSWETMEDDKLSKQVRQLEQILQHNWQRTKLDVPLQVDKSQKSKENPGRSKFQDSGKNFITDKPPPTFPHETSLLMHHYLEETSKRRKFSNIYKPETEQLVKSGTDCEKPFQEGRELYLPLYPDRKKVPPENRENEEKTHLLPKRQAFPAIPGVPAGLPAAPHLPNIQNQSGPPLPPIPAPAPLPGIPGFHQPKETLNPSAPPSGPMDPNTEMSPLHAPHKLPLPFNPPALPPPPQLPETLPHIPPVPMFPNVAAQAGGLPPQIPGLHKGHSLVEDPGKTANSMKQPLTLPPVPTLPPIPSVHRPPF